MGRGAGVSSSDIAQLVLRPGSLDWDDDDMIVLGSLPPLGTWSHIMTHRSSYWLVSYYDSNSKCYFGRLLRCIAVFMDNQLESHSHYILYKYKL